MVLFAAFSAISTTCNGLNSCTITATNAWFGNDPCPTTYKYAKVTYTCAVSTEMCECVCVCVRVGGCKCIYIIPIQCSSR